MKRRAFAKKRDENEADIVDALEAIGCHVTRMDKPVDLLVGYRSRTFLIEVKVDKGKLTEDQREFFAAWNGGNLHVARTPDQAIQIVTETIEL